MIKRLAEEVTLKKAKQMMQKNKTDMFEMFDTVKGPKYQKTHSLAKAERPSMRTKRERIE